MSEAMKFKVMNAGFPLAPSTVPWAFIAPFENGAQRNHHQSLARLNERGGLSVCELLAVIENRKWERMDGEEAAKKLNKYLAAFHVNQFRSDLVSTRSALLIALAWFDAAKIEGNLKYEGRDVSAVAELKHALATLNGAP